MKSNLVAVYGSLLSGLGNHVVMQRAEGVLVDSGVVQGFKLWAYAGKAYPCVSEGDGSVKVEVYTVDDQGLVPLDRLEGYPSFYDRKQVDVILDDGTLAKGVWIYYHHEEPNAPLVESGDWKEYING